MLDDSHNTKNNSIQMLLEESMKKIHYESYEQWVNNFAINLDKIWEEPSAGELVLCKDNESIKKQNLSAIVIGRGPSIKKFNHLELLKESDYNGSIICCDGALIDTLKAGVTPERFPNFYVATIDPVPQIKKFYDDDLIFSYPNGSYNKETLELMKKYRCKFSYTTVQETITKNTNYLEIPRFDGPQTLPL